MCLGRSPARRAPGTKKAAPREAARIGRVRAPSRVRLAGPERQGTPGPKGKTAAAWDGRSGGHATTAPGSVPGPAPRKAARNFGGFAKDVALGLPVRHDHGSQYMARPSGGAALPRHRELAGVRPGAGRRRLRGAVHPHAQEARTCLWVRSFATVEGVVPGAARLPRDLQRDPADRAARLQTTRRCQRGGAAFNPRPWPRRVQSGVSPTGGGTGMSTTGISPLATTAAAMAAAVRSGSSRRASWPRGISPGSRTRSAA